MSRNLTVDVQTYYKFKMPGWFKVALAALRKKKGDDLNKVLMADILEKYPYLKNYQPPELHK